jgi:signal transduction histidine kinase
MNLLGNALKFTASGSVQTICSVDPTISCAPGEVAVRWSIKDTGIGLSDTDRQNLWQPFSQADNSSTRRFGGTGLGLSISLSLVKLMRGDIGVESQVGVGSEFWFWIPLRIHEAAETEKVMSSLFY